MLISFKTLFPIFIGFSFWIYGNILLVKKLQNTSSDLKKSNTPIEYSMDQDLIKEFKRKESFHLNSLITKNVSLFTKNPNYKMLAWLIVQLTIFSLFIISVNIFKNNLIPYFNAWNSEKFYLKFSFNLSYSQYTKLIFLWSNDIHHFYRLPDNKSQVNLRFFFAKSTLRHLAFYKN